MKEYSLYIHLKRHQPFGSVSRLIPALDAANYCDGMTWNGNKSLF